MANPFSAVPTAYRVRARERWWYANCAWDAFGICAALGVDGRVESACPDCGEPYSVEVCDHQIDRPDLLLDRKSTRLNSSHGYISYAVFCLKKKKTDAT